MKRPKSKPPKSKKEVAGGIVGIHIIRRIRIHGGNQPRRGIILVIYLAHSVCRLRHKLREAHPILRRTGTFFAPIADFQQMHAGSGQFQRDSAFSGGGGAAIKCLPQRAISHNEPSKRLWSGLVPIVNSTPVVPKNSSPCPVWLSQSLSVTVANSLPNNPFVANCLSGALTL